MWTSRPIVRTTIRRQAVRLSTAKPAVTSKLPDGIHVSSVWRTPSSPKPPVSAVATTTIPIAHAIPTAQTGTRWARFPSRRPTTAVNRKPNRGRAMISGTSRSNISRSLAHRVVLVDQRRLLVAVDRDDDREADRRLGGGDGHDHEGDDRTVEPELRSRREGRERDDREVHGIEHQLDRHQHADRVPPGEEPEHPDREQQPGQDQVGVEGARAAAGQTDQPQRHDEERRHRRAGEHPDHSISSVGVAPSRLARNPPPITAARSSTPAISNGSTQSLKRVFARSAVWVVRRGPSPSHCVEMTARTRTTTRITAAIAAGTAWVWKTSRDGADFVWVSMIANRMRTLIAPM